jgi:hypothetical protein
MLSSKRRSPAPEGELRASLNKGQRFATTFCDLEKPHRLRHCQSPLRGRNALASLPPHGSDVLSRGLHGISPALPYHDPPLAPNARITFKLLPPYACADLCRRTVRSYGSRATAVIWGSCAQRSGGCGFYKISLPNHSRWPPAALHERMHISPISLNSENSALCRCRPLCEKPEGSVLELRWPPLLGAANPSLIL